MPNKFSYFDKETEGECKKLTQNFVLSILHHVPQSESYPVIPT